MKTLLMQLIIGMIKNLLNSEKNLQKIFQKLMISTKGDQIDIGSNLVKSNVNCC